MSVCSENADNTRRLRPMLPITGQCVEAAWDVDAAPAAMESVALQVEIEAPSEDILKQIHVGLANATIPGGNCWNRLKGLTPEGRRRTSCVSPCDGRPVQTGNRWLKTWTLPPGNYELEGMRRSS